MKYNEAKQLVSGKLTQIDKTLIMLEGLHEVAQDRLLDLMKRDLKDNGFEAD